MTNLVLIRLTLANQLVEKIYHEAEKKCIQNQADFLGRTVLLEGGGYEKIFLETQAMGGEMYINCVFVQQFDPFTGKSSAVALEGEKLY